jgi:hypothetical protein
MRNTLGDLNNHLFAQLERISDEDLTPEQLEQEIRRAKAITGIASQIIQNGNLVMRATEFANEYSGRTEVPKMLTDGGD